MCVVVDVVKGCKVVGYVSVMIVFGLGFVKV